MNTEVLLMLHNVTFCGADGGPIIKTEMLNADVYMHVCTYSRVQGIASSLPSNSLKYPGLHGHTATAISVALVNTGHG